MAVLNPILRALRRNRARLCYLEFPILVLYLHFGFAGSASATFTAFESGPVRPVALSPDKATLLVTNIPDAHLEIFDIGDSGLTHRSSVPVGLEPVSVVFRSANEAWVVNHLSDSVSIVALDGNPRVIRTLLVGDEPRDIVFAGENRERAFVTTAHRGQNSPVAPEFFEHGVGRADVWVFNSNNLGSSADGDPLAILTLFGDSPRALAVSPDGTSVFAAIFRSGNQTTVVDRVLICEGGAEAGPCEPGGLVPPGIFSAGGLPAPNRNFEGIEQPHVGLIVRHNNESDNFEDELGRNWSMILPFSLPDFDVFQIDALANPPAEKRRYSGVGTTLFNMVLNPATGRVYVSNTEANNEVRFEPNVRGDLHRARVTVIDPDAMTVNARHLNKHIDYDIIPSSPGTKERSLAIPTSMAVSADGDILYVAAYGSRKIGIFSTAELEADTFDPDASQHIELSGGGPAGLALDDERQRLYVLTRFDNTISVIGLAERRETQRILLHNPEPMTIIQGRPFLYDARLTSSNGESACASCHVFGNHDALAWDLGDPNMPVFSRQLPVFTNSGVEEQVVEFHPMKGPMTTQTLRGMATHGAMHWRGDRVGEDPFDENAAFKTFNPPFVGLLGRDSQLNAAEMDAFTRFVLQLVPPPNPVRNLDDSFTAVQEQGRNDYFSLIKDEEGGACDSCHVLDPENGNFGTSGLIIGANDGSIDNAQPFKIPHLRNLYEKVGFFNFAPELLGCQGSDCFLGPQIRGFGQANDGASAVLPTAVDTPELFEFLMAFPSDLKPVVGQQVTLTKTVSGGDVEARINLLTARASLGDCDLIVQASVDGNSRRWLLGSDGRFRSDRETDDPVSGESLRALTGSEMTFLCVPPGSGFRMALDRDEDGFLNADESEVRANPADPTDTPRTGCLGDCDGSGTVTVDEILRGVGIALGNNPVLSCYRFDPNADDVVTVDEIVRSVSAALSGCE